MLIKKTDKKNKFVSMFNTDTGFYMRSGVLDENGKDTGVDPFMASFPELLDIGIMQTCVCAHRCKVDCYQNAIGRCGENMSVEEYESIMKQCDGKMYQCALGGAGDVDTHKDFEKILSITREHNIVPSFTTSGIMMTPEKAKICKEYCGAVAVSEHNADYTDRALDMLLNAGVKTSIHYVLGNNSIEEAINRLKNDSFKDGINAVVFLLYKNCGELGHSENVLKPNDPRVKEFFDLINNKTFHHKIGFDSCTSPGIVNFTDKINLDSLDFCEGGRFSAYIDANMNMMPCSFANQNPSWHMSLRDHTIQEVWDSELFNKFRYSLNHSCPNCPNRNVCGGGCPLMNEITLCNRKERRFIQNEI